VPIRLPTVTTILALCVSLVGTASRAAEPAKIELHVLRTTTLTDEQFLTGVSEGQPASIAVELRLPTLGTTRVPAVILVHGSSGLSARDERWSRELNDIGVATLLVDSFTGRGIGSTVGDQGQLGELTTVNDAYRALELLAKHPRIDPARIGISGGSRGGVVALYASVTRFQRMHMAPGTQFAAYISFYPPCTATYVDDVDVAARPIRLFHGTADDIAPIEQCRAYVERLRRAGADVELTEYVGAQHGFDNPAGARLTRVREGSPGLAPCSRYENPVGRILNRSNDLPPSRDDECLKRPATLGYDPDATARATDAVKAILREVFRLGPAR